MNIYNYIYYVVFKSIKRTNKYTPEWTTVLMLSIVEFINVISILLLFNFSLKVLNRTQFLLIPILIFGINYLYFFKQNRIDKIKKHYNDKDKSNSSLHSIFILFYSCVSIFILCYLLDEPQYSIVPIAMVLLSSVLSRTLSNDKESNDLD